MVFSLLAIGFLFGIRHAFDADHVAAVSVLSARSKSLHAAIKQGIYWGMGHTVTLLLLGIAIFIFGLHLPESLSGFFEKIAGLLLFILGAIALKNFWQHPPMGLHIHPHPSFWVGVMHGLAGSAAIFILIVSAIQSSLLGLFYIFIFGIGSMVGMSMVCLGIGTLAVHSKKYTGLATGIFSCITAIFLLFS